MYERSFRTSSGRLVRLSSIHIRTFDHDYLEGTPALIRERELRGMPQLARRIFPGQAGLLITACEKPADEYPALVYFCEFDCLDPIKPEADCSALIVVWFADDMTLSIPEFIAARIGAIDWERHATDGWY